ncbi:pantoate--beta-alanine ligase [Oleiharenicola lentus]|uniref:pantoate--beta-alanine ligase n=1 Tax=Oleiharenicola lentus TaxID=2508720 RepID=UPI003F67B879
MTIHPNLVSWQAARAKFPSVWIGFVPTMGALHAGHRALLERAWAENDRVVLSIFVNPTQFNDQSDFAHYPKTLEADLQLAEGLVTDVIVPTYDELYPDGYRYRVTENRFSTELEGAHRPGHFDGVLTVVMKLLNLVQANRAYFGEKDWQQLALVRDMAAAFFLPTEIVACPTIREPSGLALSSRNERLSASGRAHAANFSRILRESPDANHAASALQSTGFEVDYVTDRAGIRLGAIKFEGVRLIDNVRL